MKAPSGRLEGDARRDTEAGFPPSSLVDANGDPCLDSPALMAASAAAARRLAPALCAGAGDRGEGCAAYHGFYPLLRLLGLAASPSRHADFYARALGRLAPSHGSRVLVCAAADYAMMAHVVAAYRGAGVEPEIDVVDLCETPLRLCAAYARLVGARGDLYAADVRAWDGRGYDVLCTHSLLVKFGPEERAAVVARWRSFLRPGGAVVSTVRIDPELSAATTAFAPGRDEAFADLVVGEARRQGWDGASAEDLATEARRYAAGIASHPVASRQELVELFERRGFEMAQLEIVRLPGRIGAASSGAGTSRAATYAEFVAVRR